MIFIAVSGFTLPTFSDCVQDSVYDRLKQCQAQPYMNFRAANPVSVLCGHESKSIWMKLRSRFRKTMINIEPRVHGTQIWTLNYCKLVTFTNHSYHTIPAQRTQPHTHSSSYVGPMCPACDIQWCQQRECNFAQKTVRWDSGTTVVWVLVKANRAKHLLAISSNRTNLGAGCWHEANIRNIVDTVCELPNSITWSFLCTHKNASLS